MQPLTGQRAAVRAWIGRTAVVVTTWVMLGCMAAAPVKPTPDAQEATAAPSGAVARLDKGRQGFAITENPHMSDAARKDFDRAVALLKEHDYTGAVAILEAVVEQSPGVTAPYLNLGIAYKRINKPDKAEAQFKKALTLVPGHPLVSNEYGLLCREKGRFEEARKLYEQALAAFPEYYPVRRNLGILCDLYLNDLNSALEHYELYRRAVSEDKQVDLWIADLRARMGKN